MTSQRLLPAVQALGRTFVYNRSDILHQGIRVYNNHSAQVSHPTFSGHSFIPNSEGKLRFSHHLVHKGRGSYLKILTKKISTGVHVLCREFTDGENELAHNILCSLPAYKATTVDISSVIQNYLCNLSPVLSEKSWSSLATHELVNLFFHKSKDSSLYNFSLENECYYQLCSQLVEKIPFMTDDQLQSVLSAMTLWMPSYNSTNSTNFDMLWNALDKSCSQRLLKWDISKLFLIADHWYALRISKMSGFFIQLLNYIGAHMLHLTPTQLVQYLFYVNLNRNIGFVKRTHLEWKIKEAIKFLSIEELGIVAMALFKSQTDIKNVKLLDSIIEITAKNLEIISDHSLGSILKLLKISLPSNAHSKCYKFLELLNCHLDKFNNYALLQAALLGNNLLVFHHGIMCKVGTKFGNELSVLRLKDIERFTYTLMLYKFIPPDHPNILDMIVRELRKPERMVEINHFPKCFVSCVTYLVAMGFFPHDLISSVLHPSMVHLLKSYSWDYIGRELNELNWNLKIEILPNYFGCILPQKESKELTRQFLGRVPTKTTPGLSHQEKLLLDIQLKMTAMMGIENSVLPRIILPHFSNPDLVFCTTPTGDPVELPIEFYQLPAHSLKDAKEFAHFGLAWNAVIIGGRNSFIWEFNQLRGNLEVKKRQLEKLGYRVSVVSHHHYSKSSMKYKLIYLEKALKETSSLNLEGRQEKALDILKSRAAHFDVSESPTRAFATGIS